MIKILKQDIKKLVTDQILFKSQIKTKFLVGERSIEPWTAVMKYYNNGDNLLHHYIAYGELRGKTIEQICPNIKKSYSRKQVDKIKEQYSVVV